MDHLPIDTSHPAVREYLALVRLQVLTPLSLLINIACVATSITPHIPTLGAYVAALCLGQIGYCVLLVLTKREETKRAFVNAVGLFLPLANICMALWAICFVMRWFIPCTVLQGLILLLLLFSNIALYIYHPLEESNALAIAFVHAPLRFFFVLPFTILFELSLFIAIGLTYFPSGPGEPPRDYSSWHALVGFGVLLGTNLVSLLVITTRRDLVWCIAATWIVISVWTSSPKPAPVYITALVFTVLHPLALIVSFTWNRFCSTSRQERQIVLPGDDATHPGLYNSPPQLPTTAKDRRVAEVERGPREIEVDDNTWG